MTTWKHCEQLLIKSAILLVVSPVLWFNAPVLAEDAIHNDPCTDNEVFILVHTFDCDEPVISSYEQNAYDQAFRLLENTRYEDAAERFAGFLGDYPHSSLTDDAWYWMAEALYVTRAFRQALTAFNTVVSYFANSPRIPPSRLKIGYIQYELADYTGARETLTAVLQDFPNHRVAVSAEARLKKMDREGR